MISDHCKFWYSTSHSNTHTDDVFIMWHHIMTHQVCRLGIDPWCDMHMSEYFCVLWISVTISMFCTFIYRSVYECVCVYVCNGASVADHCGFASLSNLSFSLDGVKSLQTSIKKRERGERKHKKRKPSFAGAVRAGISRSEPVYGSERSGALASTIQSEQKPFLCLRHENNPHPNLDGINRLR